MRTFIVLALAIVTGPCDARAQPGATKMPCVAGGDRDPRLLPVDEATSKTDFLQYRARLQMAVERRDIETVVSLMAPDIRLDFGGGNGVGLFRMQVLESPELWDEMRWVLGHGGSFMSEDLFSAPYVYSRWSNEYEPFECAAIAGDNVRLRSAPRLDAPVTASLSYSIVRVLYEASDPLWEHVQLGDGRSGYVWHAYVRSPIDYRAVFNLIDGRWRMTAFIAGD